MIVVGLTGSIAMGKSTVASMFAALGRAGVRRGRRGEGVLLGRRRRRIDAVFPGVLVDGKVDRDRLSKVVLGDPAALERLEGLVHPAVAAMREAFVTGAAKEGRRSRSSTCRSSSRPGPSGPSTSRRWSARP